LIYRILSIFLTRETQGVSSLKLIIAHYTLFTIFAAVLIRLEVSNQRSEVSPKLPDILANEHSWTLACTNPWSL